MPANATKIFRNVCWYVLWYWVSSTSLILHCARRSTRTSMQRVYCGWHDLLYDSPKHNNICCANAINHSPDYIITPPQFFFGENLFLTAVNLHWIAITLIRKGHSKNRQQHKWCGADDTCRVLLVLWLMGTTNTNSWYLLTSPPALSTESSISVDLCHKRSGACTPHLGFLPTHTSVSRPILIGGRNGFNSKMR